MKKPSDLRAWLLQSLPHLAADPKKLDLITVNGHVASRIGVSLSFMYRYELQIILLDYSEHADTLMVPLLAWLSKHQPDLLLAADKNGEAIKLEAEIIDADKADIRITLQLTESVRVEQNADGSYTATHLPEPDLPDLGGPTSWQIFLNDVPLAEA